MNYALWAEIIALSMVYMCSSSTALSAAAVHHTLPELDISATSSIFNEYLGQVRERESEQFTRAEPTFEQFKETSKSKKVTKKYIGTSPSTFLCTEPANDREDSSRKAAVSASDRDPAGQILTRIANARCTVKLEYWRYGGRDHDEAGDRIAITAAEIETVTDYAALFIKTAEMQPALALYCGTRKG
ncbi:hypothetical protein B0H13DRAFT_1866468 [Mycena leptocephala]|nr:hypothetical protein B0H13DRAFT_1866468 [Mycena leptocephala]